MKRIVLLATVILFTACGDPKIVAKSRNTTGDIVVLSDRKCTLPNTVSLLKYNVTYHTDQGVKHGCWEDGNITFMIQAEGGKIESVSKDNFYFYPTLP